MTVAVTVGTIHKPRRFDPVTISLHWATVVLFLGLFASAWSIDLATDRTTASLLLTIHRSLGSTLWITATSRLIWRLRFAFLPPFPPRMPKSQQLAATVSEYGLYALMLIQPVTGLIQSLTRGRPFTLFAWSVPAVMARDTGLTHLFSGIHAATALILLGLIGLHAGAALFHHFVLKDEVLSSMLPWRSPAPDA